MFAASSTRMVQLTAEGHCTRRLALPAGAVQAALRRDRHAEHAVIVLGDDGLVRLRTFSPSCTVAVDALDPLEAIDAEVQVAAADGGLCGRAAEALWSRVRGVRERRGLTARPGGHRAEGCPNPVTIQSPRRWRKSGDSWPPQPGLPSGRTREGGGPSDPF